MFLIKKKESLNKVFLIVLTALSFNISFAGTDEALQLLNNLSFLTTAIITMSGVGMLISAGVDLKNSSEKNNNSYVSPASVIVKLVIAALLFNYMGSIQMFSVSLMGDQAGYCLESNQTCLDVSSSEAMADVINKVGDDNSTVIDIITKNVDVIVEILKVVGLLHFMYSMCLFKEWNDESKNTKSGKAIKAFGYLLSGCILMNSVLFYDQFVGLSKLIFL